MYALLDRVKAERQNSGDADVTRHQDSSATPSQDSTTSNTERQPQQRAGTELYDEDSIATLQLQAVGDDMTPEQKSPSVRKLRLPGASQRTSTLKLRKRN